MHSSSHPTEFGEPGRSELGISVDPQEKLNAAAHCDTGHTSKLLCILIR